MFSKDQLLTEWADQLSGELYVYINFFNRGSAHWLPAAELRGY